MFQQMISEYLINLPINLVKIITNFFYFWYAQGLKKFLNKEINFLKEVGHDSGVIVHMKHLTDPLFGDYTYLGRAIGFFFRIGFIMIGGVIMIASIFASIFLFVIWIILPPIAIWMVISNLKVF